MGARGVLQILRLIEIDQVILISLDLKPEALEMGQARAGRGGSRVFQQGRGGNAIYGHKRSDRMDLFIQIKITDLVSARAASFITLTFSFVDSASGLPVTIFAFVAVPDRALR